eukprot:15399427-Alexandrium_andersonii.AAC.1
MANAKDVDTDAPDASVRRQPLLRQLHFMTALVNAARHDRPLKCRHRCTRQHALLERNGMQLQVQCIKARVRTVTLRQLSAMLHAEQQRAWQARQR